MEKVISVNNYNQNMDIDCIVNPASKQQGLQKENPETFDFFIFSCISLPLV